MGSRFHTMEDGAGSMRGIRLSQQQHRFLAANTTTERWRPPLIISTIGRAPTFNTSCHCMGCHQLPPQWGRGTKPKDSKLLQGAMGRITPMQVRPQLASSGATCIQKMDGSQDSTIHNTYHISLRSSSMREPRHLLSRVVRLLGLNGPGDTQHTRLPV
ncbi:hypothetical protein HPP92_021168 [Vanilla planifolia]|uniref:Uncharacterized protein n=1 Tax=Vanilla planifolia TaxID=51239 RepID=A0A835UIQ0_VANPL|nr:hypothetical protein HPP92_021168 [Vanilla planifolia]